MGASTSNLSENDYLSRDNSLRRSTKNRLSGSQSKLDKLSVAAKIVGDLKSDIDLYEGNRENERFRKFQEILTAISKEIHTVKNKSNKLQLRDRCDEILGEVQNCFQRLETRVSFNEREPPLDMAAVESHSFINRTFDKTSQQDPNVVKTLVKLEVSVKSLDKEIQQAIEAEDLKQLTAYEVEIKILYTELEMLKMDEQASDLNKRKAEIGRKLIKSNNQIKKFKKTSDKRFTRTDFGKPSVNDKSELDKIENSLEKLEVRSLTFTEPKESTAFRDLEQILENYWTKAYSIDAIEDSERQKKHELVERIKNILRELKKRAEDNTINLEKIHKIKKGVKIIKNEIEKNLEKIPQTHRLSMDQELRAHWAKLNDVEDVTDYIKSSKEGAIKDIQQALKSLSQSTQNDSAERAINNEIAQAQLLKQVEEFYNHWNILKYNLNGPDVSAKILEKLSHIVEDIVAKKDSLLSTQKILKEGVENPVVSVIVQSFRAPDLLQQESSAMANVDSEIKVQPTVKTIGEIQRIGAEAKAILQQIRESDCVKFDKEYAKFENSLTACKKAIDSMEYNRKSNAITSSEKRASKTIAEAFKCLSEKPSDERANAFRTSRAQEVMDIDIEVHYYRQQIKKFSGVVKDQQYEKIKFGLTECLNKLQTIEDVHIPKQDSIRQIQHYHQELETKLAENQAKVKLNEQLKRQTSSDIKSIIERVQKLKMQVDQFTGVHKGLYYNQIEEKLLGCLTQLNSYSNVPEEKLRSVINDLKLKVQKYLNSLEDKSIKTALEEKKSNEEQVQVEETKPSTSRESKTPEKSIEKRTIENPISPHQKINSLRDKLISIKDRTETFSGKYKDETYSEIEKELLECFAELKSIDHENHKSVIISKDNYADYIEKLLKYFEEKVTSNEMEGNVSEMKGRKNFDADPVEELRLLEDAVCELEKKILTSTHATNEAIYKDVDDQITSLMTKLNNVETGNVTHIREKKKKLAQHLYSCGTLLEEQMKKKSRPERAAKLGQINEIACKLEDVSKEIDKFVGDKNDKQYCYLDEILIGFTIKLDGIETDNDVELKSARKIAMQKILQNMKNLSEKAELRMS